MKTKAEILKRKKEIRSKIEQEIESMSEEDLTKFEDELRSLEAEERKIEKRENIMSKIGNGQITPNEIDNPFQKGEEERNYGLDSKEYRSAFFKTLAGVELNVFSVPLLPLMSDYPRPAFPTVLRSFLPPQRNKVSLPHICPWKANRSTGSMAR